MAKTFKFYVVVLYKNGEFMFETTRPGSLDNVKTFAFHHMTEKDITVKWFGPFYSSKAKQGTINKRPSTRYEIKKAKK